MSFTEQSADFLVDHSYPASGSAIRDALSSIIRRVVGMAYLVRYMPLLGGGRVKGRPIIVGEGRITIGRKILIINRYMPVEISCAKDAEITIGDNVSINHGVLIAARERITIGNNVMIGNLSIISDTFFPFVPGQGAPTDDPPRPIEIGDGAWLAGRVTVLPGSRIGRGAVIGAGSIVKGDIPPGVLAMGNPARPIARINKGIA